MREKRPRPPALASRTLLWGGSGGAGVLGREGLLLGGRHVFPKINTQRTRNGVRCCPLRDWKTREGPEGGERGRALHRTPPAPVGHLARPLPLSHLT